MKTLPNLMLITGADPHNKPLFLQRLQWSLQTGIQLVQLRTVGLSGLAYIDLVTAVRTLCSIYNARLILNPPVEGLTLPEDTGLHLTSKRLLALNTRPNFKLIGASCHNKLELIKANKLSLDYVLLSPVLATSSHPQAQPLGWNQFAKLVAKTKIPVYALGGLKRDDLITAYQYGACGIAAINGLWILNMPVP